MPWWLAATRMLGMSTWRSSEFEAALCEFPGHSPLPPPMCIHVNMGDIDSCRIGAVGEMSQL